MNLYALLGVDPHADEREIKAAFRQLAKAFHPDVSGGDTWSDRQFKAVLHAYRILEDPEKRSAYDAELALESARGRRRSRLARATVVATFLLTVATGALIVWLGQVGQPVLDMTAETRVAEAPGSSKGLHETRASQEHTAYDPYPVHPLPGSPRGSDPPELQGSGAPQLGRHDLNPDERHSSHKGDRRLPPLRPAAVTQFPKTSAGRSEGFLRARDYSELRRQMLSR